MTPPRIRIANIAAALLVGLVVPAGVAIAVGAALASVLPPRWVAGGLPYVIGWPKNVEITAVSVGLLAGVISAALAARRRLYAPMIGLALLGWWLAASHATAPAGLGPFDLLRPLALYLLVCVALSIWSPHPIAAAAVRRRPVLVAAAVAALAAFAGARWVQGVTVDTFHSGVALQSAIALLQGARPFDDLILSHGLHDAGLMALWIGWLGKVGTTPVALAMATNALLGVVALYLLARRAVGDGIGALLCAAGVVTMLLLFSAHAGVLLHLGLTVFVAAVYCLAAPGRRWRLALAGAALGAAHLYRIDASMFGGGAFAAVLAVRWLAWGGEGWRARVAGLAGDAAVAGLGLGLPLLAMRAALGWPDGNWFTYALVTLRRYHADSDGLPMPWPAAFAPQPWTVTSTAMTLMPLFLALALGTAAVRAVRASWREPRSAPAAAASEALVFFAAFALLSARTALTRSDVGHAMMWTYLPLFGALFLLFAAPLSGHVRARYATAWGLGALVVLLLGQVVVEGPARWRPLLEHLAPNPPLGDCGDTMLTRFDAEMPANQGLIEGSCAVEQALRAHGVDRLVIDHAAPWYLVRFGMLPLSRYSTLAKAYTPASQRQVIDAVHAAPRSALLRVRGYRALDRFDVDNIFRIPVAEAYLRERRRGAPVIATAIGDLVLWDEPAVPPPAPPAPLASAEVLLFVDQQTYDRGSGFLLIEGWAADAASRRPVDEVVAMYDGTQEGVALRDLPRPDAAAFLGVPQLAAGWSIAVRVPPQRWPASVEVVARMADGRQSVVRTDPSRAVVLPGLSGPEWEHLDAAVVDAEALGRRDRAAATARRR